MSSDDRVKPWSELPDDRGKTEEDARSKTGRVKCTKINASGFRCQRWSIPGGDICEHHGGRTQPAKRAAQLRLAELVNPALSVLAREMATADKSSDRQRAANSLLDRAGISRHMEVDSDTARTMLIERLIQLRDSQQDEPLQNLTELIEHDDEEENDDDDGE